MPFILGIQNYDIQFIVLTIIIRYNKSEITKCINNLDLNYNLSLFVCI